MRIGKIATAALLVWMPLTAADPVFVDLFNGKNLSGWTTTSSNWIVDQGILSLKNRTDAGEHNDSYLWTARQYGDFILELEYKIPTDRANSGVFIRTSDKNDPVQTGMEIQIGNMAAGRPLSHNSVGAIYDLATPARALHKPGEWNQYRITCQGSRISVMLNGQEASKADLALWTKVGENPDGSKNKFNRAVKDFARKGYIGLQDHGLPVEFRNIRIKSLD